MKSFIILIIFIFSISLVLGECNPTMKTTCLNGLCKSEIYSGTRFAEYKGECVGVRTEDLGDDLEVVYLEEDSRWEIKVLDYRNGKIDVDLSTGLKVFPYETDLKVIDKDNIILSQGKVGFNLFKQKDVRTIDLKIGEMLRFGDNSTTITIQTANSGNLDDTYVDEAAPTTIRGADQTSLVTDLHDIRRSMYRFNISMIPASMIITEGYLYLWVYGENFDNDEYINISAHYIYKPNNWTEEVITWNKRLTAGTDYNVSAESIVEVNGLDSLYTWKTWNVTNGLQLETSYNNVSFLLQQNATNTADAKYITFATKEYALNSSRRPYMSITYYDPDQCNYYGGNWELTTTCEYNNTNINIDGNLTLGVGGGLRLINTTLNFTSTGQYLIIEADTSLDKIYMEGTSGFNK